MAVDSYSYTENSGSSCCGFVMLDQSELLQFIPSRPLDAHKWQSACWVIAGSPGMEGAAILAARAAQRSGAGYVRLSVPNAESVEAPLEVVVTKIEKNLELEDIDRFASLVVGPGIGTDSAIMEGVRGLLQKIRKPVVVDGDGLKALRNFSFKEEVSVSTVLTPHDGEFESITGIKVTKDRERSAVQLSKEARAVVLLKGPTTVVASPQGQIEKIKAGDQRLATAGSGDVLSGIIGAFLARGATGFNAACAGAFIHGKLLSKLPMTGVVAGDLDEPLPRLLERFGLDSQREINE
ncbi:NAD(P)H-hydrate dehydratase [Acidimicrobiaceae bacterium]|nr:NAD(P)H-hydrate dehydratase [Acidimicrobiaceae bacterium]